MIMDDVQLSGVSEFRGMSPADYLVQGADLEAIAKLHKATLPPHRVPGCGICQGLYERRAELVTRYFGPTGPPGAR